MPSLCYIRSDSYGIGANDVSNSFSAAVGSKAITLKQAVLIASVCEFLGAFLMGSSTADTIKGGVIDNTLFADQPELLMLGMACSLIGSSTWVLFASSRGWPVSTTHAIIGAVTGIGIAAFGADTIQWISIAKIVLSWIVSPVCAGIVTAAIFLITKYLILIHDNSLRRGLVAIPWYFSITIFINIFYIVFKGSPGLGLSALPIGTILGISFGCSAAVFLWCFFFLRPYLRRKLEEGETTLKWYQAFYTPFVKKQEHPDPHLEALHHEESHGLPGDSEKKSGDVASIHSHGHGDINQTLKALEDNTPTIRKRLYVVFLRLKKKLSYGMEQDINQNTEEIDAIHQTATKYDPTTEQLFCVLQVLTSCFASFAHGSNDVANAVGPLATILYIWENGSVDISGTSPVPAWVLAFGGIAIDIGLLTYGYKVMATLGNKITYLSPSRGFSASLGTSLTVLTCSKLGLPVSTTHCITGSTTAVGLCSGSGLKSINWKMLGFIATSWGTF
ncbi:hypothetical protein DFQ27_002543 [Actinomortierella ambigua]|uniref:Phosphate transporter n=1 Tax=Actinomortierella ambigua TaxID=1343610 RepID=A0A9P6U621_9FUNG|nr:hypothetical protein DFQ27_002543 [Actinomortierella ambigua]